MDRCAERMLRGGTRAAIGSTLFVSPGESSSSPPRRRSPVGMAERPGHHVAMALETPLP
ncbi:MAG: hypothetical protein K2Y16_12505 [Burkholderiales bacterium]|nr:hypothetical protein [Burkholderiales bacterium]